jgi:hypothetical protein
MALPPSPSAEPEPEEEAPQSDPAALQTLARRQLHPLPPGLVELYGLLAVLFVLVPEWMAGGALLGLRLGREDADLPLASAAWQKLPELRLATLSLAELRQLARQKGIRGYGRLDRQRLTRRLLQRLPPPGGAAKSVW